MVAIISGIVDSIVNAIKEMFIGAVMSAAGGLFDTINEELINVGNNVSETPMAFSGGGPWDWLRG